jgi:hypothetical protein
MDRREYNQFSRISLRDDKEARSHTHVSHANVPSDGDRLTEDKSTNLTESICRQSCMLPF